MWTCSSAVSSDTFTTEVGEPRSKFFIRNFVDQFVIAEIDDDYSLELSPVHTLFPIGINTLFRNAGCSFPNPIKYPVMGFDNCLATII